MKIKRFILLAFSGCCLALSGAACSGLEGDNSDFDFGDMTSDAPDNPYDGQGYDRLPNSVRLATYNTHRCEGWTQNSGTDRANYNNTAKVISLMDPDVIALQELDKNTTWHQTDQLQELADRTGMRPYYCKTISYRGGDYGIGILCKTAPKNTYAGDLPGTEARKFFLAEFDGYIFIATHFCHQRDEHHQHTHYNQKDFQILSISPPTTPPIPSRSTWRGTSTRRSFRQRRSNRGRSSAPRPIPS